jgi:hypothetical protein
VWKLKKALYGTKQGALCWKKECAATLINLGFSQCVLEECIFFTKNVWIVLYVDDMAIIGRTQMDVENTITKIKRHYTIVEKGVLKSFLGVEWNFESDSIRFNQEKYINRQLADNNMLKKYYAPLPQIGEPKSIKLTLTTSNNIENYWANGYMSNKDLDLTYHLPCPIFLALAILLLMNI